MDQRDEVERILDEWGELPFGADVSGRHVIWRIEDAATHFRRAIERIRIEGIDVAPSDQKSLISLMVLRHGDPPHQRTPTELSRLLLLSSGATTSLVDRLESRGYVTREPDPRDRRGVLVGLTPKGDRIALLLHERYIALERELLAPLSDDERDLLAGLLRKLLLHLERRD